MEAAAPARCSAASRRSGAAVPRRVSPDSRATGNGVRGDRGTGAVAGSEILYRTAVRIHPFLSHRYTPTVFNLSLAAGISLVSLYTCIPRLANFLTMSPCVPVSCSLADIGFSALQVRSSSFLLHCRIIEDPGTFWPIGLISGDLVLLPTDSDSEREGPCEESTSAQSCLCLFQCCRPLLGTKVALALQMDFCHFFPPSYIFYYTSLPIYLIFLLFSYVLPFLFRHFWSPGKSSLCKYLR